MSCQSSVVSCQLLVAMGGMPRLAEVTSRIRRGSADRGIARCQVQDFHKLQVWTKAHALALEVYRQTQGFPRDEQYGLTAQMRRAVI